MVGRSNADRAQRQTIGLEERVKQVEARCARLAQDAEIQFRRIAEMQAELDELRAKSENVREWTQVRRTRRKALQDSRDDSP